MVTWLQWCGLLLQRSAYGEDDIDLEGGDAVMSDKTLYTFDNLLHQVQVRSFKLVFILYYIYVYLFTHIYIYFVTSLS